MLYYYFHGYGSNPQAKKCLIMKDILGDENVIAPDFNNASPTAIRMKLDKLVKEIKDKNMPICIVGSSLGGLFGLYVSAMADCNCILLNPCLFPQLILSKIDASFEPNSVTEVQKLNLKAYINYNPNKVKVWVTKDDEIINHKFYTKPFFYKQPAEYLKFDKKKASGHEFSGFKKIFKEYINKADE